MEALNPIENLNDLLFALRSNSTPVFVKLGSTIGHDDFLLDQILENVIQSNELPLRYQKLSGETAQQIKQELQIPKNPVLLLIEGGEIRAILSGLIAQYQIEDALEQLNA